MFALLKALFWRDWRLLWLFPAGPPEDFLRWKDETPTDGIKFPSYGDWQKNNSSGNVPPTTAQLQAQYLKELFETLGKNSKTTLTIEEDFLHLSDLRWDKIKEIGTINFQRLNQEIKWRDKNIRSLSVEQSEIKIWN